MCKRLHEALMGLKEGTRMTGIKRIITDVSV
jgi:hypothetical protein